MITQEPTKEMVAEWQSVWLQYKDQLQPNRKSAAELIDFITQTYVLTEIFNTDAAQVVADNVTQNACYAEKLPTGAVPVPRTFWVENEGNGKIFYDAAHKDPAELWGGDVTRIFVGIDTVTGFFIVEGSTMLFDALNAFRGLDEADLQNCVCVAEYIAALKRWNRLQDVLQG